MIDHIYLDRGLVALSRAHRAGGMAGHLGSALVAGYFFGEMRWDLPPGVKFAIERDLERIIGGEEAIWFNAEKVGVTIDDLFAASEKEAGDAMLGERAAPLVAAALEKNVGATRQSGHNVIFASIAIRALRDHPEYGTRSVAEGLARLMAAFDDQGPGRGYFGKEEGWKNGGAVKVESVPDPGYDDLGAMVEATVDELIASAGVRRQGFGGLHHLIDHAAGLVELANHGFPDLAHRGLKAHRHHLRLLRALPVLEEELGVLVKAEHDPLTTEFWQRRDSVQWGAALSHRIKCLYGFSVLASSLEDEGKATRAWEAMRYLLA